MVGDAVDEKRLGADAGGTRRAHLPVGVDEPAYSGHVVVGPLFLGAVEPACRLIAAEDVARRVFPQVIGDLPERVRCVDEAAFDDEPVALEVLDFAGCSGLCRA